MRRAATALVPFLCAPLSLPSQDVAHEHPRPEVAIRCIANDQAPRLDGWLTDPCWADAPVIGELRQFEPVDGAPPTQRTVVRILHDATAIYLAIECFDTSPGTIRTTQRARDAQLDPDDRVEWYFDTFLSRRNAYWFQIGAAGSRGDALIGDNGARFTKTWDCIWDGHSHVTEQGWQAEVAIPFQSLAFAPDETSWGFNLRREHRALNETDQWANIDRSSSFFRIGEAGTITGFGPRRGGIGLDVKPYAAAGASRERASPSRTSTDTDAGLDVTWRATPGLTFTATTFTDFAETEVDDRQINLTRFPLFFPEKRDFFLADASRFDFGPSSNSSQLLPYFSRRIGRTGDGRAIPIQAGLKLTGREGPYGVGLMDVQLDGVDGGPDARNLSVARITRDIGSQGTIGLVATHGDPVGDRENALLGFDWSQRFTHVLGGDLRTSTYAMKTFTSGDGGDGNAFGLDLAGKNRDWQYTIGGRRVDEGFAPALGFAQRTGVWQEYSSIDWRPRPGGDVLRNFRFGTSTRVDVPIGEQPDDLRYSLIPLGFEFESGDMIRFIVTRKYARLPDPFEIVDGLVLAPGEFWTNTFDIDSASSVGRDLSVNARYRWGGLYGGDERVLTLGMDWRTGPLLILGAKYEESRGCLPEGDFVTRNAEARVDLHFSPDLSWRNLAQYDTESRDLGVQSRLRWTVTPGSDLFVVLGAGWLRTDDGSLRPTSQDATLKFAWTFRF